MDTNFVPSLWPALLIPARGCSGSRVRRSDGLVPWRAGCKSETIEGSPSSLHLRPYAQRILIAKITHHFSLITVTITGAGPPSGAAAA